MEFLQTMADKVANWLKQAAEKSPITPLSSKEKRLLATLNDLFNTLIGYIVVISILLDISHRYTHHLLVRVFFYVLIFMVMMIFFLKLMIQLLATGVAANKFAYAFVIMILFLLIFTIFALTV